jgi:hypothetical protein
MKKIFLGLLIALVLTGAGCIQRIPSRDQIPSAPSIPSSSSNDDNLDEAFTELDLVE